MHNYVESWRWEKHEHTAAPFRLLYPPAFPNRRFIVVRNSESALKERGIARCRRGQVGNRFRLAPPSEKLRFSKGEHVTEGRKAIGVRFLQRASSFLVPMHVAKTRFLHYISPAALYMSYRKYCH